MDLINIIAFATVALLLVVSPGPNGLLIAKTVPISGKTAGFANVAGFLSAFYLHGALSILGISVILMKSSEIFFILKILGAIYLTWIGLKALISAFRNDETAVSEKPLRSKTTLFKAYFEGFLTNALNPKVSMFYLAAFPQFVPLGENTVMFAFTLVTIHAFMNTIWFCSMVIVLSRIKIMATSRVFQRVLKGVTGVIFIAFGGKLLTLKAE